MQEQTLALAKKLLQCPSVTPEDSGCQEIIANRLALCGFDNEHMRIENVDNLWATRGEQGPILVFAGHTDVVPAGPYAQWLYPPFTPTVSKGMLYGRGAADMKGSLAAMVVATEHFIQEYPNHKGRLGYLITSDEEGDAYHGTEAVMRVLSQRGETIDWAVVGEPSSTQYVGDTIKNGRRGSMLGYLTVKGIQGHVAYPQLAKNSIHLAAPAIVDLVAMEWDKGNEFFPATSFQISNMNAGTGATNVVPGEAEIVFSFRYSTESTPEQLQQRVHEILEHHALDYELRFEVKGLPFLTDSGALLTASINAVEQVRKIRPQLSTAGGTSDGRFIAPTGAEVIELGPINETIHQINECVSVKQLGELAHMYFGIMKNLLVDS